VLITDKPIFRSLLVRLWESGLSTMRFGRGLEDGGEESTIVPYLCHSYASFPTMSIRWRE